MKRQVIRLTESDLHKIIRESVKRVLREGYHDKVSDEDDEKDDFFDPDGNPPRLSRPGKKRNKNVRLPLEMEGRRSRITLRERRIEDSYPEVYNDPDYEDDSYPERYDEFYNAEDPTYTAHKGDYNGILSMLQQYGITDATIEDEDPEGEYPPTLSFTVQPDNQEAEEEIEDLVCSRGWRLMFVDPDEDNGGERWTFGYEKDDYFDDDAYPDEYNDTTDRDLDADVYENTIRRAVRESLNRLIETDCAGVMQTGCGKAPKGTDPEAGQFTVPLGADEDTTDRHGGFSVDGQADWNKNPGNVQRREIYNTKPSGKKKVKESKYDDEWAELDAQDDFLRDKYSEDYGREDPAYQMQKNDYDGVISILKQYGYDAEVSDNDPEGEYPPMLIIYHNEKKPLNLVAAINFVQSRGWTMNKQFSGEPTERGTAYVFQKD